MSVIPKADPKDDRIQIELIADPTQVLRVPTADAREIVNMAGSLYQVSDPQPAYKILVPEIDSFIKGQGRNDPIGIVNQTVFPPVPASTGLVEHLNRSGKGHGGRL